MEAHTWRKVRFLQRVRTAREVAPLYPKRPADAAAPAGPAAAGKVACKGQASPYRRRSHRGCLPLPLPAQGNHPDDTPVHACTAANAAKYTGISALSGSARAQGTAARTWFSLNTSMLSRVSRVQRGGFPIQPHASGPTSLLPVLEPRSSCQNDFKQIAKHGTTVSGGRERQRLCWSHVYLVSTTAETHHASARLQARPTSEGRKRKKAIVQKAL